MTDDERATRRHRLIRLASAGMVALRLSGLLVTLVSVPALLHHLGAERFGVWMALSSLAALLSMADLGIGAGIMNSVSEADGREDRAATRQAISSGFLGLFVAGAAFAVVGSIASQAVSWADFLRASGPGISSELQLAVLTMVLCLAVGVPCTLALRVSTGLQEGYLSNVCLAGGNLIALAGILFGVRQGLGLPWFVLCLFGAPPLTSAVLGIWYFSRRCPHLAPHIAYVSRPALRRVLKIGGGFFLLQALGAATFLSDNLILSASLGAEAVAGYAVPARLFSYVTLAVGILLTPLWPAYAEALSRGDHAWVRHTLKRSIWTAVLLAGGAGVFLNVFAEPVLHAWVGRDYVVDRQVIAALGVWVILDAVSLAISMFLNGASILKPQLLMASLLLIASLSLRIFFLRELGPVGLPLGTIVAYSVTTLIPCALLMSLFIRLATNPRGDRSRLESR